MTRLSMPVRAFARRLAAASVAAAALAGCADSALDVVPPPVLAGGTTDLMRSYVALGNSITAGYQSSGINDSLQQRAYPRLIALAAGTRYAYPAMAMPGCAPPVNDFLNQTRVAGGTASTCAFRTPGSITAALNNVAVPGATTAGLTAPTYTGANALATFILGGKTQVERALDADPSFVSLWIGNNEVLGPATQGTTAGIPTATAFAQSYAAAVNALVAGAPRLRGGVLIGVVDVGNAPILIPVAALQTNAVLRQTVQTVFLGGRQIQFLPNCTAGTTALFAFPLLTQLRQIVVGLPANATIPFACGEATVPVLGTIGTAGVLDAAERATISATVTAYNAYIRAKADSVGFAYYDPNPRLLALRSGSSPQIPVFPDLQNPAQAFGPYVSNDGVHPGTAAHRLVAQDLITAINQKYNVQIPAPPAIQ